MDFNRYNAAEQAEINAMIEKKQMSDFVHLFTRIVDQCFNECAHDFTTKAVTAKETTCVKRCADMFIKHSEIVSTEFAQLN
ncbi:hypothetical protein BDB01DRAFT_695988, partial [Pilobolus umbonatus]